MYKDLEENNSYRREGYSGVTTQVEYSGMDVKQH